MRRKPKNLICRWFGHKQPYANQKGCYSPGEEYVTMRGGTTDGIQRIHVTLHTECERCGEKYQLARSHVSNEVMKTSYEIIKYQYGKLGRKLNAEINGA